MRTCQPYLGYRGFATVLGGCAAYVADYVRSDPPVSGSLWHICATAWGPQIFVGNEWPLGVEFRASCAPSATTVRAPDPPHAGRPPLFGLAQDRSLRRRHVQPSREFAAIADVQLGPMRSRQSQHSPARQAPPTAN